MARPIMANSCAAAASAAESRFRIDRPIDETRRTVVIALDRGAEGITADVAPTASERVRFLSAAVDAAAEVRDPAEIAHEIDKSDLVIMVATSRLDVFTAARIARICASLRVPVVGLVVGRPLERAAAVSALRDHTVMLVVSETPSDLADILSDLRA